MAQRAPFSLPWQKKKLFFTVGKKPAPVAPLSPDGSWALEFQRGAIWLTVSPPRAQQGQPVAIEEILADVGNWPIASVDEAILKRITQQASGQPDIVGHLTFPAEEAVPFFVVVSPNQMAAHLLFGDPPKRIPGERTVLAGLKAPGVLKGIDRGAVQKALANWQPNSAVRVATGSIAIDGEDAYLLEVYADSQRAGLPQEGGEQSDFFRTRLAEPVPEGQTIVMKSPATPGFDGETVLGNVIAATPGVNFELGSFAGDGTVVTEDDCQLVANVAGNPSLAQGKYTVSPALHIRSNVDFSTGNIDFPGPIIIDGDVLDGFSVIAGADLNVKRVVQAATLQAGGNVVLMSGMFGNDRGSVIADGDIRASFLQVCNVKAGGDVLVNGEAIRCNIEAGGSVKVTGSGKIIGGAIKAGTQIEAKVIGSAAGVPTKVTLTTTPPTGLKRIAAAEPRSEQPSGQDKVPGKSKEKQPEKPTVKVFDMVYPPTEIIIGPARLFISTATPHCAFTLNGTNIELGAFS